MNSEKVELIQFITESTARLAELQTFWVELNVAYKASPLTISEGYLTTLGTLNTAIKLQNDLVQDAIKTLEAL